MDNKQNIADSNVLTTQQLTVLITSLKELFLSHIERIDKAVIVAHEDAVRVPTDIQKAVGGLREFMDQKIQNIYEKFEVIEKIRIEQKIDSRQTLLDTFAASKEAIRKQEDAFVKQIEGQSVNLITIRKVLDDKIDDLKDRVGRIEGVAVGGLSQKKEQREISNATWGIIATILGIIFFILGYFIHNS